jgi:hypothetical protein
MSTYTGPTPFTGDGSTLGPYAFSWGYLEADDVHVYVDGSPKVSGTDYNALAAGPQPSGRRSPSRPAVPRPTAR